VYCIIFWYDQKFIRYLYHIKDVVAMKVLICPDKFKECLKANEVAAHIRSGIMKAMPDAECLLLPMADGGEGTVEALVKATRGTIQKANVHDPLMRPIHSYYGISGDAKTAFIEMAAASGLALLKPEERNPLITTSFGTGELIRHALDKGFNEIILAIGGSATVDGGAGMAQALGIRLMDEFEQEISRGGGSLSRLTDIDFSVFDQRLKKCKIYAACDVLNPLTGPKGAACIYGPQKGATNTMVRKLDANLKHFSKVILDLLNTDVEKLEGGGAAGGMGAGIVAFLDGELRPGFELISHMVKLDIWINKADLIITGEGKLDSQTAFGKVPAGVATMAQKSNKPVIAFTGSVNEEPDHFKKMGFKAVIPIADRPLTLQQSILHAGKLLENAAERSFNLIRLGQWS
jgi:glycerate 2-kinase